MPPGSYTVLISALDFRTATLENVRVDSNAAARVDAIPQIGISERVVVTASRIE